MTNINKTKVLFLAHLPPPIHGAAMAGNYIQNSTYINSELDTTYINLATNKKLHETGRLTLEKVRTLLKLIKNLWSTLSNKPIDLCHMSLTAGGNGFYKDALMVFILKLFRKKIVYHFHNKGVTTGSKNFINNLIYKYVFKNSSSILLSPHLYPDISKYVKEDKVYYCPYGIPFMPLTDTKSKFEQNELRYCKFLYLSNMMKEKGAYVLLDALRLINDKGLKFSCDFVGGWTDIKENDFLKKIEQFGLTDKVKVHGPKYNREKYAFFNNADVFVFPTFYHYETFGIVNLEAMQYKLPVISTPEGGIPDVIEDGVTGFLVSQRSATELADKMEYFILNPDKRAEMGEKGRIRYDSKFTLEVFEHRLTRILESVVNSSK